MLAIEEMNSDKLSTSRAQLALLRFYDQLISRLYKCSLKISFRQKKNRIYIKKEKRNQTQTEDQKLLAEPLVKIGTTFDSFTVTTDPLHPFCSP